MIQLEADSDGFPCPHCGKTFSVRDWNTEYNDPLPGTSRAFCPACDQYFFMDVEITVTITPYKTT